MQWTGIGFCSDISKNYTHPQPKNCDTSNFMHLIFKYFTVLYNKMLHLSPFLRKSCSIVQGYKCSWTISVELPGATGEPTGSKASENAWCTWIGASTAPGPTHLPNNTEQQMEGTYCTYCISSFFRRRKISLISYHTINCTMEYHEQMEASCWTAAAWVRLPL